MAGKKQIMDGRVPVRFTAAQIRLLAPALSLLYSSYQKYLEAGSSEMSYPFRMFPPPRGFDRGTFHQPFMDEIFDLGKILKLRSPKRRKVKVNTIQLRAAIFALRVNISFARYSMRQHRKDREVKANLHKHKKSIAQLKARSQNMIRSLERALKRENRTLLKTVGKQKYAALTAKWKAHLRWMRVHIVYFKPLWQPVPGLRKRQQKDIDVLMEMARRGLRDARHQQPNDKDLRHIMRLYARYARQGRQGDMTVHFLVENKKRFTNAYHLAHFAIDRLNIKEIRKQ